MSSTNQQNTLSTIEKIKSFAIAVVGAGIFSMGSTYFSAQSTYRIPKILLPIYEIFGNIGLAIGMLILGFILLYYAYHVFTKNNGKKTIIIIFEVIAILIFYGIIYSTNNQSSKKERNESSQQSFENIDRPTLDSDIANSYLNKLEILEKKFEKSVNEKDKAQYDICEKEYDAITTELGDAIKEMSGKSEYPDFAKYNAKILEKIQVYRVHKW